jgi:NAD(P)-dependent dehydrogenase (short-subunit alcohol dehydrogenase family)
MRKSIVITGASKGIGRAAADRLAEQGWSVIGVARSSPRHFPGVFIETDLADQNQTYALAKDLAARGNVFGIVNNVGVARHETIDAVDFEVFTTVMDLNVRPALQLTQALLPNMRSARFGRIINVTSLVTRGLAFRSSYAAAKAALESLTRTMATKRVLAWIWSRRSTSYWSRNERSGLAGCVRISASSQHPCRHGSSRSAWRVTGSSSTRSSANIAITRRCIGRA